MVWGDRVRCGHGRLVIVLTERNPFVVERLLHLLRRQSVGERESLTLQQRPPHQVKRSLRATTGWCQRQETLLGPACSRIPRKVSPRAKAKPSRSHHKTQPLAPPSDSSPSPRSKHSPSRVRPAAARRPRVNQVRQCHSGLTHFCLRFSSHPAEFGGLPLEQAQVISSGNGLPLLSWNGRFCWSCVSVVGSIPSM